MGTGATERAAGSSEPARDGGDCIVIAFGSTTLVSVRGPVNGGSSFREAFVARSADSARVDVSLSTVDATAVAFYTESTVPVLPSTHLVLLRAQNHGSPLSQGQSVSTLATQHVSLAVVDG